MSIPLRLLRGTLDGLVLKALWTGELHGYGIAAWVHDVTEGVLKIEDGALYTALHRLEDRGLLDSSWGVSDRGRKAKFYSLTRKGRRALKAEERDWQRYAEAVGRVFGAARGEA